MQITSVAPRLVRSLIGASALALAATGCAALSGDDTGTANADAPVVAAFYPLQYVTARVAGDHFDVENLTRPGGEPHDLELTPQQTAAVAQAPLVVFEDGFQPAVDAAVDETAAGATLDAADVVDLQPIDHEAEGHEEHGHEEAAEEDEHDHGSLDPHFWQDPMRMAALGDAVADEFADIDPDHAEEYAANAEALRADMTELDTAFTDGLADCKRDTIVVSHDAFGYLARYGLHLEPIAGLSPDAEPTPAQLAELQSLIRTEGITTVFSETLASPKMAETLADDLQISTAVLDPIEGLTDTTADEDYRSLMEANLVALQKANGC